MMHGFTIRRVSVLCIMMTFIVGCWLSVSVPAGAYNEAPMLTALVKQGKLPPVDERLPRDPMIVHPVEEIGQYGGVWRRALIAVTDRYAYDVLVYDGLLKWQYKDGKLTVVPNLAKSMEVSDNGKVYTFHLRRGLKWSDGQPCTADDFIFWYKDVLLNQDLTPVFPSWLVAGGEPVKIEKVDDYTIRFRFGKPYSIFPEMMARAAVQPLPKHYLKNFHPSYVPIDKLTKMAKERSFEFWHQLFADRNDFFLNPDRPVLSAWKVTVPLPGARMIAERNPYYWKVDPSGNQLPYIDRLTLELVQDRDIIVMKAMAGEIDMQYRSIGFQNYTLLMEARQKGDYRILKWQPAIGFAALYINQNVKDPILRKLFEDRRFRMALSYAINREEVNQILFYGQARIANPVSRPGDPFWKDEFGKTAIEYNTAKANKLLDEVGLTKRDANGFRLRPDGKTLTVTIECFSFEIGVNAIDVYEMVRQYWEKVGIKTAVKEIDRSLWVARATAGEIDIPGYDIATLNWVVEPLWYVPVQKETYWAPLYGTWYAAGGKGGEEPTGDIRRLQQLYDELKITVDPAKRLKLGQEILSIHDRNLYVIGIVQMPFQPVVVKNNFRNVLENPPADTRTYHEGITWPEQCFIRHK